MCNSVVKGDPGRSFSCAFVSFEMPDGIAEKITRRGAHIIKLPPFSALDRPVASHPDMLIFTLRDKILLPRQYYDENAEIFGGFDVLCADEVFSPDYPHDVALNALELECGIFCLEKAASKRIKEYGKKIINVAQGYARCSCVKVDENAVITADPSIALAAKDAGVDVLQVCGGEIALPGYAYGFIGGCSTVIGDEVCFFGDITAHPDYNAIEEFIYSHGKKAVSLSSGILTDYGGAVFI